MALLVKLDLSPLPHNVPDKLRSVNEVNGSLESTSPPIPAHGILHIIMLMKGILKGLRVCSLSLVPHLMNTSVFGPMTRVLSMFHNVI